jgi:U3 small nucleolar RNA-associated protein 13
VTEDHNLLLYDAASLELTRTIVGYNDEITDLKFIAAPPAGMAAPPAGISPGPSQLAVATNSDQIRLFDLARMGCRLLLGHTDVVLCLAASKSGSLLASASKDATVRLWDASSGRPVGRCVGHTDAIGAVAFGGKESAAAGKEAAGGPPLGIPAVLLSASKDRTMKRWDLSPLLGRGKQKAGGRDTAGGGPMELRCASTVLAHGKEVNALAVSPNDKLAISGSQDRSLKVWALGSGGETGGASADALSIGAEPLGVLKGHKRAVWACAFSPVDRVAASGSGDMTVRIALC